MFEHVPNVVLFNKHLEPPHNTATVPDSHGGRISGEAMIAEGTGWDWVPLPAEPAQGEAPQPVQFVPVVPEASEPQTDYDAKTVSELQQMLKDRDLPTTGNKGELIDRLTEADSAETSSQEG